MRMFLLLILSCLVYESYGSPGFTAYWNVPVNKCQRVGVTFDLDQYGIVHNDNNDFHGDKVNLFYRNGFSFPFIDEHGKTINEGIPQRGNLTLSIDTFQKAFTAYENSDFSGVSVLDFEDYLPAYNGFLPKVCREASLDYARSKHPNWTSDALQEFSVASFNESVQPYFKLPLVNNKEHSPKALIGYYHYPYCHNFNAPYNKCPQNSKDLNDRLQDTIFNASTALYPSAYMFKKHGPLYHDYLSTLLDETNRVNLKELPVIPYYWYRYHNVDPPTYLPDDMALSVLALIKSKGGSGVVLWGNNMEPDLADKPACLKLQAYVTRFLGPALKCMAEISDETMNRLNALYPVVSVREPESQANLHIRTTILKFLCKLGA